MDKNGNITISYETWKNGIQTPLTGMGDIVNIDIFDKAGVAKISKAPTALATTNFTDIPTIGAVRPGSTEIWLGDLDGILYNYTSQTNLLTSETAGSGGIENGVWWKGYLIVTDRSLATVALDAFDGTTWDDSWKSYTADSTSDGAFNKIHSSPADNDLYIGYGRYIARISEVTTFDPTDSGSWTSVDKFLTLPSGYIVRDISTIANFLVVSASISTGVTSASSFSGSRLYYWDLGQTATAAVEFTGFVDVNANVAAPLISKDNNIYYYNWIDKDWSATNLSSTSPLLKINNQEELLKGGYLVGYKDCVDITNRQFVLGLSTVSVSGFQTDVKPAGVYHILGDAYTRNVVSTGEVGENEDLDIRFVRTIGLGEYLVGYKDGVTPSYVVDHFGKDGYRYTSYSAYMESPLYQVSGSLKKKSYQQLEVSLAKELATGQGVRVSYRKNLTDSFTTIATLDFATYGAQAQFNVPAKITDASTLQIKVELTTGASSTTTPELISVRVF